MPQEHGWAHLHSVEQISWSHFPESLFYLDSAGCWQECHAALWASAAPLLHAPLCREGRTNTLFQSRWTAGGSVLWRAIFEQEKGCWGQKKSAFLLPEALTYSPGPDWGNGITLLLLPIFTVPAIWAIRSCQLQQKQEIKPCSKWSRMSISLFNPLKPS